MSRKKVLLISPITEEYSGIQNFGAPSIGIHRIAAYLRDWGHEVEIYDSNISPPFSSYLKLTFDVIGISILADTLISSLKFIKKLRGYWPEAKIIAGGIEASLNYQTILDYSPVDAVCLGEGEDVMLSICDDRSPFHSIPGLVIKNRARPINNDSLWGYWSRYDFSKAEYRRYWKVNRQFETAYAEDSPLREPLVRLVTSSHCRRRCTYCSVRLWHEQACDSDVPVAYLSPPQIDTLLTKIRKQLPETKIIYFTEDDLIVTRKRIHGLLPILKKHPFRYQIQTSTWMLTEEIVKSLAEAGCFHITCGVESASAYVRDSLNKHQDNKKIEAIIDWCRKYKINCYYLIIMFSAKTRMEDLWINYRTLSRWMEKGVIISIEPREWIYKGSLDSESNADFQYESYGVNGHRLRQPTVLLPDDSEVRGLMQTFMARWPHFKEEMAKAEGQKHFFKGTTGKWMVALLRELLEEREAI